MTKHYGFRMRVMSMLMCLALGACSTATINRSGGPALEAKIVDGDSGFIYVEDDVGMLYQISRAEIASIDHPGNVLASFGGVLLATALMAMAATSGNSNEATTRKILGAVYGVPGAVMLSYGMWTWYQSNDAVKNHGFRRLRSPIRGRVVLPQRLNLRSPVAVPGPIVVPRTPVEALPPEPELPPAPQLPPVPELPPVPVVAPEQATP